MYPFQNILFEFLTLVQVDPWEIPDHQMFMDLEKTQVHNRNNHNNNYDKFLVAVIMKPSGKRVFMGIIQEPFEVTYVRGKKILEQLSRPQFFPGFEISRSFLRAKQVEKRAGNFKSRKKSCS